MVPRIPPFGLHSSLLSSKLLPVINFSPKKVPVKICEFQTTSIAMQKANNRLLSQTPIWSASTPEDAKTSVLFLIDRGCWKLSLNRQGLEREFKFKTFSKAMKFINAVATQCSVKRHHPEWANVYDRVQIRWTTHNPKGLSQKDLEMAEFCDLKAAELGEEITTVQKESKGDDEFNSNVGGKSTIDIFESLMGREEIICEPCHIKKVTPGGEISESPPVNRKSEPLLSPHLEDTLGCSILEEVAEKRDQYNLIEPEDFKSENA